MVKLFYIGVFHKKANDQVICLKDASELSSFGFFQRGSVSEFMKFTSKVVIERTEVGTRVSVQEQDYMCHAYVHSNRLGSIVISDQEYPKRVAHTVLLKVQDDFTAAIPYATWSNSGDNSVPFLGLDATLAKYQEPREADMLTKLQADVDETKIILHNTITALLDRGEKLDDLVAKSDELSAQSKVFYKTARKTNQCCRYMP